MDYQVFSIELKKQGQALYFGQIKDQRTLTNITKEFKLYFAIQAYMPTSKLIETVPSEVKISSQEVINTVVQKALPGIKLKHRVGIEWMKNFSRGFQFFELDTENPFWEGIKESKTIAVYLPESIPNPKIKLYCIRDRRIKPPIFDDCYEAVENLLNLFTHEGEWWGCVRPNYWEIHSRRFRGQTTFKIRAEKRESPPDRKWLISGDRRGIDDYNNQILSLSWRIKRGTTFPEFYITIDLESRRMRFFLLNFDFPPRFYIADTFEVKLGENWVESFRQIKGHPTFG